MKMRNILLGLAIALSLPALASVTDDVFKIGKKASTADKKLVFDIGLGVSNPFFRVHPSSGFLEFTNDGSSFTAVGAATNTAPTVQKFTSTGTGTGYLFIVSSATAANGATYTNNGQTFTVAGAISSQTMFYATGTGAPAASGTLTKATGTGDSTITFSAFQVAATYTRPTSPAPLYIKFRMVGGGGGGGSSGNTSGCCGSNGKNTSFGTSIAFGGSVGIVNAGPFGGGAASLGAGVSGLAVVGGQGSGPGTIVSGSASGGAGGSSMLGSGAGAPGGTGNVNGGGVNALANSGGGGSGGSAGTLGGGGGGSGGYVDAIITTPAASYFYTIGAGGVGESSGGGGSAGGSGGSGILIVEEFYQ